MLYQIRNVRQASTFPQHSYGMPRVDGIPARFDIGFPLPENEDKKDKGDIAGITAGLSSIPAKPPGAA
jgi:hypothetical protein